jgi:hypothetical protein
MTPDAASSQPRKRAWKRWALVLAYVVAGCAHESSKSPFAIVPPAATLIRTEAEAIAVVRADFARRGADPKQEEWSAIKDGERWLVNAWHIFYPANVGESRFVPGGFMMYIVSSDGKIVRTIPGL